MWHSPATFILVLFSLPLSPSGLQGLTFDPDDYLEVYPDPRDDDVLQGRTPLYFSLIQSLGGPLSQFDASGSVAGVKIALDRINNDSSLLPGYTLHYTFANSKCNRTVSLNVLYSQLFHEPKKVAIIGSGCSVATEAAAEVSHFYNITQMSCVSSSASLSNRVRFPRYFQLLSSAKRIAFGYFNIIKEYRWRRVALIVQDESLFTVPMNLLKDLLKNESVNSSERVFSTNGGIDELELNIFDENSRIFILSMYRRHAIEFVCEAYHRGLQFPRYLFVTIGWYSNFWWREDEQNLSCTTEERENVLGHSLVVSDEIFLDAKRDANVMTTPGITVEEFLAEEKELIGQPPLNITASSYSSYCHDNTWILAYALNSTLNSLENDTVNEEIMQTFNLSSPFKLEDFNYDNYKVLEIIFGHLSETSFHGLTGLINFGDDGIREIANLLFSQFRNVTEGNRTVLDRVEFGRGTDDTFTYNAGEDQETVWGGLVPYDGVAEERFVTVHPAVTSVFSAIAFAGIGFSFVCLIFNFIYRNSKLMKLASNKLNYLIAVGAVILYIDTIFFVVPVDSPNVAIGICNLIPWLTAVGYSLCYGTILAKMTRVYYIFNNPTAQKKKASDAILFLGVASLVGIDLIILITYTLVEGVQDHFKVVIIPNRENPRTLEGELGIVTENFVYVCDSKARNIFLGILYGYKMLLQIIALLFAFSIRKVRIKGLNDAKYIAAIIYVTSIVLAVIIVATYTLKDFINGFAALFCTGFLVGTSTILILVFVPMMVGLYKDPKGDNVFRDSNSTDVLNKTELSSVKMRIMQLEDEVKEKNAVIKRLREHQHSASLPELNEIKQSKESLDDI